MQTTPPPKNTVHFKVVDGILAFQTMATVLVEVQFQMIHSFLPSEEKFLFLTNSIDKKQESVKKMDHSDVQLTRLKMGDRS